MAGRTQACVLTLTCVAIMAGLGLVIAGAAGSAWWNIPPTTIDGLWCRQEFDNECIARENVLTFDDKNQDADKDIILLCLIVASFTTVVALVVSLAMFSCKKSRGRWMCTAWIITILCIFSALFALGGVVFAEIKFDENWKVYDHGWSSIAAWAGAGDLFVTAILCMILICLSPPKNGQCSIVRSQSNTLYESDQYQMSVTSSIRPNYQHQEPRNHRSNHYNPAYEEERDSRNSREIRPNYRY